MRCRECEGELSHEARARGTCRSCQDLLDDRARRQAAGQRAASGLPAAVLPKAKQPADILLTTESSSALPIIERFGIISAECVLGMNAFKDLGIGLRDIFGGRSAG